MKTPSVWFSYKIRLDLGVTNCFYIYLGDGDLIESFSGNTGLVCLVKSINETSSGHSCAGALWFGRFFS